MIIDDITLLARVVRKVDSAIHRINHYPVDSVVCCVNTFPASRGSFPGVRLREKRDLCHILVPRGRAPFGQHQESRPLARSNDIPFLNGFENTID